MTTPRSRQPAPMTAVERLGVTVPAKGWAITDSDVVRVFGDTGEEVDAIAFDEQCRCHRWFTAADGGQWQATEIAYHETRRRPAKGERFVVETRYGQTERVTRYSATRGDLEAHLAELAAAGYDLAHPRDGAHAYSVAVPLMLDGIRTVDDVLAHLEGIGARPVRMGSRIALTVPVASPLLGNMGAQYHRRPGDPERDLLETWAPLILARLGGPAVGCDVASCERAADSLAMGGAMICAGHLEAAVGEEPPRPSRLRTAVAAITSVVGG